MRDYNVIFKELINKKIYRDDFHYPGEVLERCVVEFPEDANEISTALIEVLKKAKTLSDDMFNSDQVKRFCKLIDKKDADWINLFVNKTIISKTRKEHFKDVDSYLDLIEYLNYAYNTIIRQFKDETKADKVEELKILFGSTLEHFDLLFGCTNKKLTNLINLLTISLDTVPKAHLKFAKTLIKATEDVLKDKDYNVLLNNGYDILDAKYLNAILCSSDIGNRTERARFNFEKEIMFGEIPMKEEHKLYLDSYYSTDHNSDLSRIIDGHSRMYEAIGSAGTLKDTCANVDYAFEWLDTYGIYDFEYKGLAYSKLNDEHKKKFLINKIVRCNDASKQYITYYKENYNDLFIQLECYVLFDLLNKDLLDASEIKNISCLKDLAYRQITAPISKKTLSILREIPIEEWRKNVIQSFYSCSVQNGIVYSVNDSEHSLSIEEQLELYNLKEEYFFKMDPVHYSYFLYYTILNTDEEIHTYDEWKQLLPYFKKQLNSNDYEAIIKKITPPEVFAKMQQKKAEEELKSNLNKISQNIENATTFSDLISNYKEINTVDINQTLVNKAFEILKTNVDDYNYSAERLFESLFYDSVISGEEFLKYWEVRKERHNRKENE